ncbi:related to Peroxisomal coenzyme A diphosphatase 1, peroxisomal [Saccharomycodes ludwigii]|uniref:Related to Peroxisomal coenzyme A diphosphatase 1, peroxisomal n=1 Tax=Saccharomycodes ludwigii TaxID=36035 RepID=A0A376BBN2_9ASCO|nr:related to Peroxisomal coenzyme A diphosphatase 1, peroxisomal [Saccharomycodes ludwigii]
MNFEIISRLGTIKANNSCSQFPLEIVWPPYRRSAVFILLFVGLNGELRVLLTRRSRKIRSFSGDVSLPGGKADNIKETCMDIARRETFEEIGLPQDDHILESKYNIKLENLCNGKWPCYLSKNFLSVKPTIWFMHNNNSTTSNNNKYSEPLKLKKWFGHLNDGETSSIFSIPLKDAISVKTQSSLPHEYSRFKEIGYKWGGISRNILYYYYYTNSPNFHEVSWLKDIGDMSSDEEYNSGSISENIKVKKLWGLTAQILYDIASVGYQTDPLLLPNKSISDKTNRIIGHETLLYGLHEFAHQMNSSKRSKWEKDMIANNPKAKFDQVIPVFYTK